MSDLYSLTEEEIAKAISWTQNNVDPDDVASLPVAAFDEYPGLAALTGERPSLLSPAKWAKVQLNLAAFVIEVADIQDDAAGKAGPVDGCLGSKTLSYLRSRFTDATGWVYQGGRVGSSYLGGDAIKRVTFMDDQFWRLDKASGRTQDCKFVVAHWGGRSPRSLQNYFAGCDRDVSSHGSVGYEADGSIIATQTIDLSDVSWHGGWINRYSVGMDIAFSPEVSRADYGRARGWPINVIDNPTNRGDKQIIDIPEELAEATAWLLCEWASLLDVPMKWVSRDPAALLSKDDVLESEGGFIMHSQFASNKWDCAPWGQKLMDATDRVSRLIGS